MLANHPKNVEIKKIGNYNLNNVTLGKGNFAKVELATHTLLDIQVAMKIIDLDQVKEDYVIRNLEREKRVLSRLKHPNIVSLYETMKTNTLYCLVLEYIPGGDLGNFIKSHTDHRLPECIAKHFFYQLLSAVKHMHDQKILHRDLKLENVLLDEFSNVKLVDFGLSNFFDLNRPLKTHCGSPEYAAPELFMPKSKYGPAVDMWSLGVILFAMLVGSLPFRYPRREADTVRERRKLLLEKISKGLDKGHKEAMRNLTPECFKLVQSLLEPDQNKRMKLCEALDHCWFDDEYQDSHIQEHAPDFHEAIHSKVSSQVSKLFNMDEKVIGKHLIKVDNRYDSVYGTFHLLVDARKKEAKKSNGTNLNDDVEENTLKETKEIKQKADPKLEGKWSEPSSYNALEEGKLSNLSDLCVNFNKYIKIHTPIKKPNSNLTAHHSRLSGSKLSNKNASRSTSASTVNNNSDSLIFHDKLFKNSHNVAPTYNKDNIKERGKTLVMHTKQAAADNKTLFKSSSTSHHRRETDPKILNKGSVHISSHLKNECHCASKVDSSSAFSKLKDNASARSMLIHKSQSENVGGSALSSLTSTGRLSGTCSRESPLREPFRSYSRTYHNHAKNRRSFGIPDRTSTESPLPSKLVSCYGTRHPSSNIIHENNSLLKSRHKINTGQNIGNSQQPLTKRQISHLLCHQKNVCNRSSVDSNLQQNWKQSPLRTSSHMICNPPKLLQTKEVMLPPQRNRLITIPKQKIPKSPEFQIRNQNRTSENKATDNFAVLNKPVIHRRKNSSTVYGTG